MLKSFAGTDDSYQIMMDMFEMIHDDNLRDHVSSVEICGYGGSGKTSFILFLEHYIKKLKQPTQHAVKENILQVFEDHEKNGTYGNIFVLYDKLSSSVVAKSPVPLFFCSNKIIESSVNLKPEGGKKKIILKMNGQNTILQYETCEKEIEAYMERKQLDLDHVIRNSIMELILVLKQFLGKDLPVHFAKYSFAARKQDRCWRDRFEKSRLK